MNRKITAIGLVVLASALATGCKKKEETSGAAASAAPAESAPAAAADTAAPSTDVATYPNMTPQGGTVRLLQPFKVHQAADATSPTIASLGVGTLVDLKNSYSNWMMIMWPSGVGQLSPGWIELRTISDNRVTQVTGQTAASATPVASAVPSAVPSASAAPTASAAASASAPVRPVFKIPVRKK
jgi:hypothetical protein